MAKIEGGNVLLFSREFTEPKYEIFTKNNYQLDSANVEYLVYWYDAQEEKEYKVVLPRLKFKKTII